MFNLHRRPLLIFFIGAFIFIGRPLCGVSESLRDQNTFPFHDKAVVLKDKIAQIPLEDRRSIDSFFRIFLLKESGAYTLFGDKPVSLDAYFDASPDEVISPKNKACLENKRLRHGWETWLKYQSQFPSDRYVLKATRLDQNRTEIVLINKQAFLNVVSDNISDFTSIISNDITPAWLLETYEKGQLSLFELVNRHHGLLGILLGFSKQNAWLYHIRNTTNDSDAHVVARRPHPFSLRAKNLNNQTMSLSNAFPNMNHNKCYSYLYLPGFIVDSESTETKKLLKKYLEQRQLIHDSYSHGDFLEITLKNFVKM